MAKSATTALILLSSCGFCQHVRAGASCLIDIYVYVVHPDNSRTNIGMATCGPGDYPIYSANLSAGDSVLIEYAFTPGNHPCSAEGLIVRADSASTPGPILFDVECGPTGMRFAQTGTFFIYGYGELIDATGHMVLTVTSDGSVGIVGLSGSAISIASINGSLEIEADAGSDLEVRNVTGQLILKQRLISTSGTQHIPFSNEPTGIYIATLIDGKMTHRERFFHN